MRHTRKSHLLDTTVMQRALRWCSRLSAIYNEYTWPIVRFFVFVSVSYLHAFVSPHKHWGGWGQVSSAVFHRAPTYVCGHHALVAAPRARKHLQRWGGLFGRALARMHAYTCVLLFANLHPHLSCCILLYVVSSVARFIRVSFVVSLVHIHR